MATAEVRRRAAFREEHGVVARTQKARLADGAAAAFGGRVKTDVVGNLALDAAQLAGQHGAEIGTPILAGNDEPDEIRLPLSPAHVAWEIVDTQAHSGERSYYSGYNNSECLSIGTGPLTLSNGTAPMLEFWTRYGIEAGWDGGVVQASTDGGSTWMTLTPLGG